jgi:hypothetical protein
MKGNKSRNYRVTYALVILCCLLVVAGCQQKSPDVVQADQTPVPTQSTLLNGLAASWPLAGNAIDRSTNGNNGIMYGVSPANNRWGDPNAADRFDGVSSYIDFGRDPSLRIAGDLTIAMWVYPEGTLNQETLITKEYVREFDLTFQLRKLEYYSGPDWPANEVAFPYTFSPKTWYHVAVTRDADTKIVSLYVDGQLAGTHPYRQDPPYSDHALYVGARKFENENYFKGIIHDIYIFERTLTGDEIMRIYNNRVYPPS